ncbi:MAG TPA: peptidoglycan bridge formation glycyltransferase FemA/FemB family protein [Candidatus Parcubacteria bacterium]|jgi:lipid II:glycine glycyltransferase (peptidoglycan interpeptide bridge formation enzyme)|nr:hypothetical protein [Parcubacteria group bacterium]HJN62157.1 peptidoglycan bridge formation glycyltransferase FemA/FemB family protein [Candidatus Parcubacteria bacterium]|tara:strand:+ start:18883 stop:19905 length:1023 start_codon:yes stop_codon:yes gene_type:complete
MQIINCQIKEIINKEAWENFLAEIKEKTLLQSWNWGEFNKVRGDKIWRLGIYDNEKLIGTALTIKVKSKRGTFLFVPHIVKLPKNILKVLTDHLKELAKKEKASFIRIAPVWEKNEENKEIFKELGFREAPIHMHPELTWELDIIPTEEDLLKNMRKTTRYLIRQAKKNPDIKIEQSKNIEDIDKFQNLYKKTVQRHHFIAFPSDYLKNQFSSFLGDNQISIFLGEYKGELISSAIVVFWQGLAFYHHGASSTKYPKVPVSYLLQWEVIKEAKKRGCKLYNFWGIAPDNNKKHPWAGLTLFKMGFGGYKKEYIKTQDLPLSNKYWLTYIFERIRKFKRHL